MKVKAGDWVIVRKLHQTMPYRVTSVIEKAEKTRGVVLLDGENGEKCATTTDEINKIIKL